MRKVIVVESSAKTKTIRRFLKGEYVVIACGGHIVDLAPGTLAVDVENDFSCIVHPIDKKRIEYLKKHLMDSDEIYLATDPDREGEAIAADIFETCIPDNANVHRIEFNAIVYHAVIEALKNPRQINQELVNAQRARRSLDRLIGFILSAVTQHDPEGPSLPAVGRVMSPAVSLVVDREYERRIFKERRYWELNALLDYHGAEFEVAIAGEWDNFNEAKRAVEDLQKTGSMRVISCEEEKDHFKNPMPSYTTDTLQDDADRILGLSPEVTMKLAQQLYQGIDIDGSSHALITYMRTDSTRVSPEALNLAKKTLGARNDFAGDLYHGRTWKPDGSAQDAHEAVRPTMPDDPDFFPEKLNGKLDGRMLDLYRLIYYRFLASQMKPAVYHVTSVNLESGSLKAKAVGYHLMSEGFMGAYKMIYNEYGPKETAIPVIDQGTDVHIVRAWPEPHKTTPPPRYREGALVRKLKDLGIGRPSTYGETLRKIKRGNGGYGYIEKRGKTLRPTERGERLCHFLSSRYPNVISYEYTSGMESSLSEIEHGNLLYKEFLKDQFKWLRHPYEHAMNMGWLDRGRPAPSQLRFLSELAARLGITVPQNMLESRDQVTSWINKLQKETETKVPIYELSEIEEVNVRGIWCYRVSVFIDGNLSPETRDYLRNIGMRRRRVQSDHRLCFQYQRRDFENVNRIRGLILKKLSYKTISPDKANNNVVEASCKK